MGLFTEIQHLLNDIEAYHDSFTFTHEIRTGELMNMLCTQAGYDKEYSESVGRAGTVHDIGKIAVPAKILEKPGPLSIFEKEVIKLHTEVGYKLLKNVRHPLGELAAQITITHHEAYDGSGYPNGLKGQNIPLEGRICAICDIYDALRSQRPYRDALSHQAVLNMMKSNSPNGLRPKLDPTLLEAFLAINGRVEKLYNNDATQQDDDVDPPGR